MNKKEKKALKGIVNVILFIPPFIGFLLIVAVSFLISIPFWLFNKKSLNQTKPLKYEIDWLNKI